ncbi:MAG: hypothetical protein WCT46_03555 [Candidatus Gracilibacteria bacterium]|jgi:hypothetical protein
MKDDKKNVDIMKWLKENVATKKDLEKELKPIRKELVSHGNRLDSIEKNMATKQDLVRIYESLADHEMRLSMVEENMATKQDLAKMSDSLNTTLDRILETVTRTGQELIMLKHVVEKHDDVIRQIKPMLGLA